MADVEHTLADVEHTHLEGLEFGFRVQGLGLRVEG